MKKKIWDKNVVLMRTRRAHLFGADERSHDAELGTQEELQPHDDGGHDRVARHLEEVVRDAGVDLHEGPLLHRAFVVVSRLLLGEERVSEGEEGHQDRDDGRGGEEEGEGDLPGHLEAEEVELFGTGVEEGVEVLVVGELGAQDVEDVGLRASFHEEKQFSESFPAGEKWPWEREVKRQGSLASTLTD